MIIYLVICILDIKQITSFIVKDSFNILMKDSVVYSIDISINPDEYEMIGSINHELGGNDIRKMLNDLNKLAKNDYDKISEEPVTQDTGTNKDINRYLTQEDNEYITTFVPAALKNLHKRDSEFPKEKNTYDYDYRELLNEYYEIDDNIKLNNITNDTTRKEDRITREKPCDNKQFDNCSNESNGHFDFKAIICSINDLGTTKQSPKSILIRLWRVIKIWLFVYFTIAIPLWCTRGWCCCCLCCKFVKPQNTIDEAKKYFLLNPPGLLTVPGIGVIYYEATPMEKESYKTFGHLIRTI